MVKAEGSRGEKGAECGKGPPKPRTCLEWVSPPAQETVWYSVMGTGWQSEAWGQLLAFSLPYCVTLGESLPSPSTTQYYCLKKFFFK